MWHWICSRCPQFAPFTGRCELRPLWNPQCFIVHTKRLGMLVRNEPPPHFEQILNVFIRFTFLNAYSKKKSREGLNCYLLINYIGLHVENVI